MILYLVMSQHCVCVCVCVCVWYEIRLTGRENRLRTGSPSPASLPLSPAEGGGDPLQMGRWNLEGEGGHLLLLVRGLPERMGGVGNSRSQLDRHTRRASL